jgi:hypothetical protein
VENHKDDTDDLTTRENFQHGEFPVESVNPRSLCTLVSSRLLAVYTETECVMQMNPSLCS